MNSNSDTGAFIEMPKYVCHKEVHALKIKSVKYNHNESVNIFFEDEKYGVRNVEDTILVSKLPKEVTDDFGYLVVYKDGYTSWSPTKAFEDGYELMQ